MKPVVKRAHKSPSDSQDRRNFYLNLGFGLVVVAALLLLVAAAGLSFYNEHLVSTGSVNGQSINKDELRDRVIIETWRLDAAERRVATQVGTGRLTEAEAAQQTEVIGQQRQRIVAIALERLIDNRLQSVLATEQGITVTPADIDARLVEEATTPGARHGWLIEVEPALAEGATEPTATAKAEAKKKADAALVALKGGTPWEDVAKTTSTDSATAQQGGDLGFIEDDDRSLDEAFVKALYAVAADTPTDVLEGEDGTYRIGRVTEIVEPVVDPLFETKLKNDGVDLAKYRTVVAGDVVRKKLEDAIVAEVIKPGPQRRASEIYIRTPDAAIEPNSVKTRHILYSPKNDPQGAGEVPAADPSWAAAEKEARATYDRIKANPVLFDSIARAESDEGTALGVSGSGGKLGFYGPASNLDEAFRAAITKEGLAPGQLLEPVRSAFGWHVIQIMYRPPDADQATKLKGLADGSADFAQLARDFSEGESAGAGGDLGWIARGQLDERLLAAIFAAPLGKTTEIVTIEDDGIYLFKVAAEETRTPEGAQLEQLRQTAFSDWYTEKKKAATIVRDDAISASPTQ
ncbi:MAG: peptidylprolyl isomerase [Chloroflexi bacterium]|nr:peptidylprolyl isomerase [Chloroflexota bacterium]